MAELEAQWRRKLEQASMVHADEKEAQMRMHRDNLLKALEEARARWQQVGHPPLKATLSRSQPVGVVPHLYHHR